MATLDVVSLTEAKQALQLTGTTAHDTVLAAWITGVSLRLDRLVGPVVRRTVTAEPHDGGANRVHLRYHPNTSVTSVTEYDGTTGTVLTAETNALKPDDAYKALAYSADAAYRSNILVRRGGNADAVFAAGLENVEVTYVAGRFADTASVDERFKRGTALMLKNLWRSQVDGVGQVGEYDVPAVNFPAFAVPRAVRELFDGEIQDPLPL